MPTLLLRLAGAMQSWGIASRFGRRDTGKEPSKSGVLGLLCAALGIDRTDWAGLEPLTRLRMGVRHDRPGLLKCDYHTAGCSAKDGIRKADGSLAKDGVLSQREYLADAVFLVGLSGEDLPLLQRAHQALADPTWPLALGRKSLVPGEPVWLADGLSHMQLVPALSAYPWLALRDRCTRPEHLLLSYDSADGIGAMRMDQPLASFAERRFGSRFVTVERIPCPQKEVANASVSLNP